MENKKGNKGLVVIFVILLLGVFFFLGYITCKNNFFNLEKVTNTSKNKDCEETQEIRDKDKKYTLFELKQSLAKYEFLFDNIHDLKDIPKDRLYTAVFNQTYNRENKNVTLDEFNFAYKKTIFNEINVEPQDIGFDDPCMGMILYKYNDTNKSFEYVELGGHDCGFGTFPVVANRGIYDFKIQGNKYILTEYVIYSRPHPEERDNNDNRKYYKTYEDATNGANVLFEQNNTIDPFDDVHSKFIDYKDSLQKATFTFEEKNGVLTLVDYILA